MSKLLDDCFLHDRDRLRHGDAVALLESRLTAIASQETVNLENASGRILAQAVTAPRNIPSSDNAAVDGYAFVHADHEPTGGFFPVVARLPAGSGATQLPGFSAARIFTGAAMPDGADTVAMQEDCEPHEQDGTQFIVIPGGLKKGANCRKAGEDVASGSVVVKQHSRLRPQDIAAIASTGASCIQTFKQLRVGIVSSGDEVLRPGAPFETGKVYDANQYMLASLLRTMPVEAIDLGVCPDNLASVTQLLEKTSKDVDVIISSGGASRGEEDHFVSALEQLGKCHMWQLAIKPGRPMCFGQIGDVPCFTLPGNPVAAFVCFLLYVYPALTRLGGGDWPEPQRIPVASAFAMTSKPDRREYLRGFLVPFGENGELHAHKFERDGSGLISGLQAATGLVEIPEDCTRIDIGQPVNFIPLSQFGIVS